MKGRASFLTGLVFLVAVDAVSAMEQAIAPPTIPAPNLKLLRPPDEKLATSSEDLIDPVKAAEIRRMMDLIGTQKQLETIKARMLDSLRQRKTNVPPEFWDDLDRDMDVQKLMDQQVTLFAKYYTLEDLKALNAFYASPAGQHMVAVMPQAMAESMRLGQEWGKQAILRASLQMPDLKRRMNEIAPPDKALPATAPSTNAPAAAPPKSAPPVPPPAPRASTIGSAAPSANPPERLNFAPRPILNTQAQPVMNTAPTPVMNTTPAPVMRDLVPAQVDGTESSR